LRDPELKISIRIIHIESVVLGIALTHENNNVGRRPELINSVHTQT
jgi:hypothetical protein